MEKIFDLDRRSPTLALIAAALTTLAALFFTPSYTEAGTCEESMAEIVSVEGVVEAKRAGEMSWEPVKLHDTFCPGDQLRVQLQSRSAVVLQSGAVLRLDQKSTITFIGVDKPQTSIIDLLSGVVHFFSHQPRSLKVTTPFLNGAVEGTEFLVQVTEDRTLLSVFSGKVNAANNAGSIVLASGQAATAAAGSAPAATVVMHPRDSVRWALYYPPVIVPGEVSPGTGEAAAHAYRAAQLLTVGRADEAGTEIEQALALSPGDGLALSLQSIIALAQNDTAEALHLAESAVEADSRSAAAHLALSYARQARFDLANARAGLLAAARQDPGNALLWARLAELHLSFGDLGKAREAAQKAFALAPGLERTQTVLGFAHLANFDTTSAGTAFAEAIRLNQAAPLPHLGLGLARIRDGHLEEGRREIEVAVSLDPGRSLLRSYLGKAFFEEKHNRLAERHFSAAQELDPKDPTSWFYDAIRKQTLNRPVEALRDMQQSITLNDNRAVYRSRLLLDSDLAARSSSLARIYQDLGFEQRALVEGWQSLNSDPGNYSAHRFLADTYVTLPRHEIARVSELLQSQLRQPININPIQPHLAEGSLSILERAGPSDPSFNEFNPLFQRDRLALQVSGVAGGNDTFGDEIALSGIRGKLSFSLGQFHFQTDGFRENNDLRQDVYNVFLQASLSYQTSIQGEFRYTETERGDLPLRFDPELFFVEERGREDTHSFRFGLRHVFSPRSDVLLSLQHVAGDEKVILFPGDELSAEDEGFQGEVQHLFRGEFLSVTSGLGYLDADRRDVFVLGGLPLEDAKSDLRHANIYLYPRFEIPARFTWTLGLSADFLEGAALERDQVNPKAGLTWSPSPATMLRAAVFRTLNRTLLASQTLEPTQVAGFNQFFDDGEGVDAWRYGLGLDQKFSAALYGGVEISRRDLDVPFTTLPAPPAPPEDAVASWQEDFARGYLYWTPHTWLAITAELHYERLERDEQFVGPELYTGIDTLRLPLGLGFFHPSGAIVKARTTYVDQEGTFGDPFAGDLVDAGDSFWVVDASLGYRLPGRRGIITLEATNLFDRKFSFQDTDPSNPRIAPGRLFTARATLSF